MLQHQIQCLRCIWLLIVGLACTAPTAQGFAYRPCDDADRPVAVAGVTLTPNPPVIGSPATFLVQGASSLAVVSGSVEIEVSFSGVPIYAMSEDLCEKTSCPVAPGAFSLTLIEDLPPIAPPGEYGLRVTGRDAAGNELLCLDVDFELVLPSAEAGESVSSGSGHQQQLAQHKLQVVNRKMDAGTLQFSAVQ